MRMSLVEVNRTENKDLEGDWIHAALKRLRWGETRFWKSAIPSSDQITFCLSRAILGAAISFALGSGIVILGIWK